MSDYIELIDKMKGLGHGLMPKHQYVAIADVLSKCVPCRLLVFGLGYDSVIWDTMNLDGETVFVEDDLEWTEKISNECPLHGQIKHVHYQTKVENHKDIGYDVSKLQMDMGLDGSWDFVFVDAPLGHQPPRPFAGPGRMISIYQAYQLLKSGGIAVVDDMTRPIEREYSKHFFGEENMFNIVDNKIGFFYQKEYA